MATVYLNGYLPKYLQNFLRGLILLHDTPERRACAKLVRLMCTVLWLLCFVTVCVLSTEPVYEFPIMLRMKSHYVPKKQTTVWSL